MPSFSRNKPDTSSSGDLFGMVSNLFNTTQSNPTTDVDDIINNVHSKINLVPTEENMMETLTVTEDIPNELYYKLYPIYDSNIHDEKKEVIDEANKIYDVESVIPSIYLASELSRNKL